MHKKSFKLDKKCLTIPSKTGQKRIPLKTQSPQLSFSRGPLTLYNKITDRRIFDIEKQNCNPNENKNKTAKKQKNRASYFSLNKNQRYSRNSFDLDSFLIQVKNGRKQLADVKNYESDRNSNRCQQNSTKITRLRTHRKNSKSNVQNYMKIKNLPNCQKKQKIKKYNQLICNNNININKRIKTEQCQTNNPVQQNLTKYNSFSQSKQNKNGPKSHNTQTIFKIELSKIKMTNGKKLKLDEKNKHRKIVPWEEIDFISKQIISKHITKRQSSSHHIANQNQNVNTEKEQPAQMNSNIPPSSKIIQKQAANTNSNQPSLPLPLQPQCLPNKALNMIQIQLQKINPIGQNINQIKQLIKKYNSFENKQTNPANPQQKFKNKQSLLQIYLLYKKFFYMRSSLYEEIKQNWGDEHGALVLNCFNSKQWAQIEMSQQYQQCTSKMQNQNKYILSNLQKMYKKLTNCPQCNQSNKNTDMLKIILDSQQLYEHFVTKMLSINISKFNQIHSAMQTKLEDADADSDGLVLGHYGICIIYAILDQIQDQQLYQQITTFINQFKNKMKLSDKIVKPKQKLNQMSGCQLKQILRILNKIQQYFSKQIKSADE